MFTAASSAGARCHCRACHRRAQRAREQPEELLRVAAALQLDEEAADDTDAGASGQRSFRIFSDRSASDREAFEWSGTRHNCDLLSNPEFLIRPMLRFFSLPDYNFDELVVPAVAFAGRLAAARWCGATCP